MLCLNADRNRNQHANIGRDRTRRKEDLLVSYGRYEFNRYADTLRFTSSPGLQADYYALSRTAALPGVAESLLQMHSIPPGN